MSIYYEDDSGCLNGGSIRNAYLYVNYKSIYSESDYPYYGRTR